MPTTSSDGSAVLIATWNLEWARSRARIDAVSRHLERLQPDIVVFTEIDARPTDHGHWVEAEGDWGYGVEATRRKVTMWSRTPWRSLELGGPGATCGRLITATTSVASTDVTVIGVCIPWRDAHVRTGPVCHGDVWREHLDFCSSLGPIVADRAIGGACVLAGDWNQRIPARGQPRHVVDALSAAIKPLSVHTHGATEVGQLIDHIATTPDLVSIASTVWPGTLDGIRVSDHTGVAVELESILTARLRNELLGAALDDWEREDGAFTAAELADPAAALRVDAPAPEVGPAASPR
jgi:exonuclease III